MKSQSEAPDKDYAYGRFNNREDDYHTFAKKMAYKATDTPLDDMNVNVKNGLGFKEILGLGFIFTMVVFVLLVGLALFVYLWKHQYPQPIGTQAVHPSSVFIEEGDTNNPPIKVRFGEPR